MSVGAFLCLLLASLAVVSLIDDTDRDFKHLGPTSSTEHWTQFGFVQVADLLVCPLSEGTFE